MNPSIWKNNNYSLWDFLKNLGSKNYLRWSNISNIKILFYSTALIMNSGESFAAILICKPNHVRSLSSFSHRYHDDDCGEPTAFCAPYRIDTSYSNRSDDLNYYISFKVNDSSINAIRDFVINRQDGSYTESEYNDPNFPSKTAYDTVDVKVSGVCETLAQKF